MNSDTLAGNWKQMVGKAREKWGKLTDNELEVIGGKKDQLVGKIQEKYGISREEAQRQVDEFARTAPSSQAENARSGTTAQQTRTSGGQY
jgi:uncharacterized protein YjbJ (UPF0337 family)